MSADTHRPRWKTLLAFSIIYFVWGSTFYAIRVGVHEVPPLLFAALRFIVAGLLVFFWALIARERSPRGREWLSVFLLAFLIFVCDYGFLFLGRAARSLGHRRGRARHNSRLHGAL